MNATRKRRRQRPKVKHAATPAKRPRDGSAARAGEESEAAPTGKAVIVNRHQLALILGVHPDRVSEYGQAGLPVLHRGGVGGSEESRRNRYDAISCAQWVRRHRPGGVDALDARARLDVKRREEIELRLQVKRREFVRALEMDLRWTAIGAQLRTTLLGLPTRARQRLPHLTAADLVVLDGLVREVLDEFALQGASAHVASG